MSSDIRVPSKPHQRIFASPPWRLVSLDVLRGLVMVAVLGGGFGIPEIARTVPQDTQWRAYRALCEPVVWTGCAPADFMRPLLYFIAGVALVFALENRSLVMSRVWLYGRTAMRSFLLLATGLFLESLEARQTVFSFTHPVTQIGMLVFVVALFWRASYLLQIVSITVAVGVYWYAMASHPLAANWLPAGATLPEGYVVLEGSQAAWNIHGNAAAQFDRGLLNAFPRADVYQFSPDGRHTLGLLCSFAMMMTGFVTGHWIRADFSQQRRVGVLIIVGLLALWFGNYLHDERWCYVIPKLESPSWFLYSMGWALLLCAMSYTLLEISNMRPLAGPFVALGRNSLFLYLLYRITGPWWIDQVRIHAGRWLFIWLAQQAWLPKAWSTAWKQSPPDSLFALAGPYAPIYEHLWVLVVLWVIALWMHRRRVYLVL